MNLRSNITALPWISAVVGIVGTVAPFLLPVPTSWNVVDAWLTYLFILVIAALLLWLACLEWRQLRDSQLPSPQICALILHLSKHGFSGMPSDFNNQAEAILYGEKLSAMLPSNADYYSQLVSGGLMAVSSVTDHGDRSDGKPDTTVSIYLTERGKNILRIISVTKNVT